jgi:protein ImuB
VLGGRQFELVLFRVDGAVRRLRVGTASPLRDAERITGLFSERLSALGDDLDTGCGFDIIRLTVPVHAPLEAGQGDFSRSSELGGQIDQLLDRIAARLGDGTGAHVHPVQRAVAIESHMPERAEMRQPAICESVGTAGASPAPGPVSTMQASHSHMMRPVRFLDPPEPVEVMAEIPDGAPVRFKWRRVTCHVARAEGPERIAGEWWNDDDVTDETLTPQARDYYRVEDRDGRRYWLFRAGLYDRTTGQAGAPRWFMQGLFA